ncbi:MAG: tRNA adenosine(34) deaminase TadA [Pyrinomonadaceae bacterium]
MNKHEFFMNIALFEANSAGKLDEVPVGACIVNSFGEVIAAAGNRSIELNDPTAHAEVLAIRRACEKVDNYRLTEMTLYTTIEPCVMCAGALVNARIATLVFGADDKRFGAVRSKFSLCDTGSLNHQMEIIPNVLAAECGQLMTDFFGKKRGNKYE